MGCRIAQVFEPASNIKHQARRGGLTGRRSGLLDLARDHGRRRADVLGLHREIAGGGGSAEGHCGTIERAELAEGVGQGVQNEDEAEDTVCGVGVYAYGREYLGRARRRAIFAARAGSGVHPELANEGAENAFFFTDSSYVAVRT